MSIFELIFLQNYRLDHSEKDRNRIVGSFGVVIAEENYQCLSFVHCNPDGPEVPEFFVEIGYIGFQSSYFSKPTGLISSFKVPIESFLLVLKCSVNNHCFFPCSGILIDQNFQEMLLVLKRQDIQTYFFSSTCFVSPSGCQWIRFQLRRTIRF